MPPWHPFAPPALIINKRPCLAVFPLSHHLFGNAIKVIKLPLGAAFGQRHSLNCLMKGIKRGYCGNKKGDHVVLSSVVSNFSHEKNGHRVSWQYNGRKEPFSNGNLMHATNARPR